MGTAFVSPLRYPGGKGALAPFLGQLISDQTHRCATYVEPFAGGAGAAVRLLVDEYVERIILNDLDPGVAAFWRCVFGRTDELVRRIESCELSIDEWYRQRTVFEATPNEDIELGFAIFFLNRTNRSGILNARPIGGLQQTGRWKIDARFNREELVNRVRRLGKYRNRVDIVQEDGIKFLANVLNDDEACFAYVDPPYLEKATDLYMNTLSWNDHERLAELMRSSAASWMVSYDHDDRVPQTLYPGLRCIDFSLAHTAAKQHVGREYAVFSDSLDLDALRLLRK